MKRFRNLAVFLFFSLGLAIIIAGSLFNYYLCPVSNDNSMQKIEIKNGNKVDEVIDLLYTKKLIRNPKVFKIYLKMQGVDEFKEGIFNIKPSMSSKEIINYLTPDSEQ